MPQKTNCSEAHSGRDPEPCVHCKEPYSKSSRYVHLVQKKNDPKHTVFYEYVKNKYSYADDDCICRRCDKRLHNLMKEDAIGPAKKIKVESVLYGASCSTTDTRTEFDVSFEIDQPELEQVSVSQYETHTSDQNTCYLQGKQMCGSVCDTLSLENKFFYEKIHNKFCEYILGLKKTACNISAKSELGRFSITDFI